MAYLQSFSFLLHRGDGAVRTKGKENHHEEQEYRGESRSLQPVGGSRRQEKGSMRARAIKPGYFKNEGLAACSQAERLLFVGLWLLADREGRLEDRPKRIEAEIFPYEEMNVEKLLDELAVDRDGNGAFIRRYIMEGHRYIAIVNFLRHQYPHKNEQKSIIPAPPEGFPNKTSKIIRKFSESIRPFPVLARLYY